MHQLADRQLHVPVEEQGRERAHQQQKPDARVEQVPGRQDRRDNPVERNVVDQLPVKGRHPDDVDQIRVASKTDDRAPAVGGRVFEIGKQFSDSGLIGGTVRHRSFIRAKEKRVSVPPSLNWSSMSARLSAEKLTSWIIMA